MHDQDCAGGASCHVHMAKHKAMIRPRGTVRDQEIDQRRGLPLLQSVDVGGAGCPHDWRQPPQPAPAEPGTATYFQVRRRASWPVGRVLCTRSRGPAAIHLGLPLLAASCGLPASSGGPPSNARAGNAPARARPPLDLAPGGVYQAAAVTCGAGGLLPHRQISTTCAFDQMLRCSPPIVRGGYVAAPAPCSFLLAHADAPGLLAHADAPGG